MLKLDYEKRLKEYQNLIAQNPKWAAKVKQDQQRLLGDQSKKKAPGAKRSAAGSGIGGVKRPRKDQIADSQDNDYEGVDDDYSGEDDDQHERVQRYKYDNDSDYNSRQDNDFDGAHRSGEKGQFKNLKKGLGS